MPRVFKRGEKWYVDYRLNGRRIWKSVGTSKRLAQDYLKHIEAGIVRGELLFVLLRDGGLSRYEAIQRSSCPRYRIVVYPLETGDESIWIELRYDPLQLSDRFPLLYLRTG